MKGFLDRHDGELWMTEFAAAEVSSAVARLFRMGALTLEAALDALTDFDVFRSGVIEFADLTAADVRTAHAYVRRFELKLRTPDALHVAVAERLGLTLVTLDRRLADAAATLGIAVVVPA